MNWQNKIVSDKDILLGKPTIKGTRLSVEFIIERLASGWTQEQLLENYPRLTREDLQAVFAYASELENKDGWQRLFAAIEENQIDVDITDLAHQHDHYLYSKPKRED
ncbi:MAG: DUF433 domain-containing protein [Acidobacteria bacterium]|nr:DUF433 domain-containing protein [Acidobacteriota bacterium]